MFIPICRLIRRKNERNHRNSKRSYPKWFSDTQAKPLAVFEERTSFDKKSDCFVRLITFLPIMTIYISIDVKNNLMNLHSRKHINNLKMQHK